MAARHATKLADEEHHKLYGKLMKNANGLGVFVTDTRTTIHTLESVPGNHRFVLKPSSYSDAPQLLCYRHPTAKIGPSPLGSRHTGTPSHGNVPPPLRCNLRPRPSRPLSCPQALACCRQLPPPLLHCRPRPRPPRRLYHPVRPLSLPITRQIFPTLRSWLHPGSTGPPLHVPLTTPTSIFVCLLLCTTIKVFRTEAPENILPYVRRSRRVGGHPPGQGLPAIRLGLGKEETFSLLYRPRQRHPRLMWERTKSVLYTGRRRLVQERGHALQRGLGIAPSRSDIILCQRQLR